MPELYVVTTKPGRFPNMHAVLVKHATMHIKDAMKHASSACNVYRVHALGWGKGQVIDLMHTRNELVLEGDMSV